MADRVTIVDVAARAGVAISSVSSAINDRPGVSEQTRARILAAAAELGFVPSIRGRSLSGKRAYAIGLVVHREPEVLELDPFFAGFIGGIESAIDQRGYALVLQIGAGRSETLDRYRRLAADRRVDGVFLSELGVDDARVGLLRELRMPAIGINAGEGFPFPSVHQDHRPSIEALVAHLADHGHERVAHVSGPPDFIHAQQRREAWERALTDRGLPVGVVVEGGFTYEGGVAAASDLLSRSDRPTAVFCANDLAAIGFIAEAQRMGFDVPGDVSVAGYDGIQLGAYVRPALTTVTTSPRQIGARAATMLLDVIDGLEVHDTSIEPAEFTVRASTGPAPR